MAFDITLIIFEITGYNNNIADEITHEVASLLRRNKSLTQLSLRGMLSSFYIINMILVTFLALLLQVIDFSMT